MSFLNLNQSPMNPFQSSVVNPFYLQDLSRMNPVQRVRGAANDVELLQDLSRMNPVQRVRGAANDVELQNLAADKDFRSAAYLSKSASEKMSALWSEISKDTNPASFPNALTLAGLFLADMNLSFSTEGDAMPSNGIFG